MSLELRDDLDLLDGASALGGAAAEEIKYVHLVEEAVEGLGSGEFPLAAMVMPAYDSTRFGDYKYETGFPYWGIWLPIFAGLIAAIPSALAAGGRKHVEP